MITAIEIENFKGVSDRVRVDFSAITLLFGRNSAGKSTVLQALHYFREVLRNNLNARATERGGGAVDLGGFQNVVHGRDLRRSVRMKLEFMPDEETYDLHAVPIGTLPGEAADALELEVRWNDALSRPELRSIACFVRGAHVFTVELSEGIRDIAISRLSVKHPALTVEADADYIADGVEALRQFVGGVPGEDLGARIPVKLHPLHTLWISDAEVTRLARRSRIETEWFAPGAADLASVRGAKDEDERESRKRLMAFGQFLEPIYFGVPDRALHVLDSSRYIGPLREVPSRFFDPTRKPDEARWANGLAAWDALHSVSPDVVQDVASWLSREDRLGTGYQIRRREYREVDTETELGAGLERGDLEETATDYSRDFRALPLQRRLVIYDEGRRLDVAPHDVGVGISQLVPVVTAARLPESAGGNFLCVEQPELHVHPAVQTGLGDLFLASRATRRFLIETHSEHLVLRLLRRIRETTENAVPEAALRVAPGDVSVVYIETDDAGALRMTRLHINETGEFIDRWPKGFFAERMRELL